MELTWQTWIVASLCSDWFFMMRKIDSNSKPDAKSESDYGQLLNYSIIIEIWLLVGSHRKNCVVLWSISSMLIPLRVQFDFQNFKKKSSGIRGYVFPILAMFPGWESGDMYSPLLNTGEYHPGHSVTRVPISPVLPYWGSLGDKLWSGEHGRMMCSAATEYFPREQEMLSWVKILWPWLP